MDLWDLTKLLFRRWIIAAPMIALTVTAAALTAANTTPDYTATAYIQLVPPVGDQQATTLSTPDRRNPWIALGLQTIGNAAIVTVTDQSFLKELRAAGYSDAYTLVMNDRSPLITIEAVAKSGDLATRTTNRIVEQYIQDIKRLQSDYGVAPADAIVAYRLGRGTNLRTSNSKMKRALVAVAGAGVFVTIAMTVAIDALLKRRSRRRIERREALKLQSSSAAPSDASPAEAPDAPRPDAADAARPTAVVPAPRSSPEDGVNASLADTVVIPKSMFAEHTLQQEEATARRRRPRRPRKQGRQPQATADEGEPPAGPGAPGGTSAPPPLP